MAKFAVYTIPTADSDLYRRGSELLGYDVRAGAFLPPSNPTRSALPEFDPAWIDLPQTYGFHVTTGYSLYFDIDALPKVEAEMENACACFGRDVEFTLTPGVDGDADQRITYWGEDQSIVVLRCTPNPALLMLHTLLTARVNPLGSGSNVSQAYARRDPATIDPVLATRVRQYHTPYMLDGWTPHFTLLMPYAGTQRAAMHAALLDLFPADPVNVTSVCLLVRRDGETHYRLHREFALRDAISEPTQRPQIE